MFGFLKKKLSDGVKKLSAKVEEAPPAPKEPKKAAEKPLMKPAKPERGVEPKPTKTIIPEAVTPEPKAPVEKPEQKTRFGFFKRITERSLTEKDIDDFFDENEAGFMQANVAVEVIDFLRQGLKERLVGRPVKRAGASGLITQAFHETLFEAVNREPIDLKKLASEARKNRKPLCVVFLGFNGSGKTTSIAKVAKHLLDAGHKPVLAAADTFRAASIEQLEHHGSKLGVNVIKHDYGSDAAAVVFDAKKYAEKNGCDVVLADTAGRMHTDKNLMDELTKLIRVNQPDLKILVVDSLTGNDAVQQARQFNGAVGVDGVIMAKTDVNEKGGSILSVCYAIKKPIVFMGTGQDYGDLKPFSPEEFIESVLG